MPVKMGIGGARDLGVGVLCGVLLGAYVGWAFGPDRPRPPSFTATARAAARGRACPPAYVPPGTSADDAAVIAAQDWQIRALSEAAFGRPLVWPDPAMPSEAEEALEEALASCAPEVRFVETDCSEPPCLAVFDFDGGATVSDLCPDIPRYGYTASSVECPDGSQHRVHVVKLGGHARNYREGNRFKGLGMNELKRFQARAEDLGAFVCP